MFSTSGDILNIVLTVCAIALTFFLCWGIYYLVVATHKFYKIVKRAEKGVAKAEEILDTVQDKVKNSAPYMMILGEVAKQAMSFMKDRQTKKRPKPGRKNKESEEE